MKCPNCGKEIAEDSNFCEFCGAKITQLNESQTSKGEEKQEKKGWEVILLIVVILILTGWLVNEHIIHSQISDSLKLSQRQIEADSLTIDSLQNIISQTDDKILLISDDNFEDFVSMSSQHLVIIDYYGKWCGPCRRLDPVLYDMVRKYHNNLTVGRYIVDDFKEKYVKKYDITGIPTLIFLVDGVEKKRIVGYSKESKTNIIETIESSINGKPSNHLSGEFVDLGLPSGTLWKAENEDCGLITYDQAMKFYGSSLPTKEQWEELKNDCLWTRTSNGYKVKGKNCKSIYLPAAGYRSCGGSVNLVGSRGNYWSSTPNGSEYAWNLGFHSSRVSMGYGTHCCGRSVRLVR